MKKITALLLSVLMLISVFVSCDNTDPSESSAPEPDSGEVTISQRFFFFDKKEMYERLYSMFVSDASADTLASEAQNIIDYMKGWSYSGDPVGGFGYSGKIYTAEAAKYICYSDDDFKSAVAKAVSGDVIFIPSGVTIDLSDLFASESYIATLDEGVILASDRGINEGGTLQLSNPSGYLLRCSDNTVITGLNLSGVIAVSGENDQSVFDYGISIDAKNVTVSNCEFAAFNGAAVTVDSSGSAVVDHCFIHNNVTGVEEFGGEVTVTNSAFFGNGTDFVEGVSSAVLPAGNVNLVPKTSSEPLIAQVQPDLTSAFFPADSYEVYAVLKEIAAGNTDRIVDALSIHAGTTNYYEFIDQFTIEKDGVTYGITDDGTPLGGGKGYATIHTTGDHVVNDLAGLLRVTNIAKSGEVIYIAPDAKIDITNQTVHIPAGVTIASNRGYVNSDGSVATGGMLYTTRRTDEAIRMGEGSTITGLAIASTDTRVHLEHFTRYYINNVITAPYYRLLTSSAVCISEDNVTVTNCEITGFSEAAVNISGGATGVTVSHCYLHHNRRYGFGYGVVVYDKNTTAEIYRNLFNFDRHAIASRGEVGSGYIAHDNIHMGTSVHHIFDAHGGKDRGDGTDIACELIEMTHNVFLSDKIPYKLRGTPTEYQLFQYNIVIYPEICYTYNELLYGTNCIIKDNIWGISDPVYSFEGGTEYELELNTDRYTVNIYSYDEYKTINSTECGLSGKTVLFFNGSGDGKYYLERYGKNIADGTTFDVPEGGFIISYPYNPVGTKLYRVLESAYAPLKAGETMETFGDFRAVIDGNVVTITVGTLSD